jgi:hypothetical protein
MRRLGLRSEGLLAAVLLALTGWNGPRGTAACRPRSRWVLLAAVLVLGVGCKEKPEPPPPDEPPGERCEDAPLPSCEELQRNCGPATDTCGRTVECGTCSATQTCGGGGTGGVCGGRTCEVDCPSPYQCTYDGICRGGPRDALALDAKAFEVEGQFLNDGAPITDCTGATFPKLAFTELQTGAEYLLKRDCDPATGWTFKTRLPPGAYRLDVRGIQVGGATIGRLRLVEFLSVQSDRKGLALDVSAQRVAIAGHIVVNGPPPLPTQSPRWLQFVEPSTGNVIALSLDAEGRFQGRLPRGAYRVTLFGPGAPMGTHALVGTLQVDGPQEGVELTLAPNRLEVAGRITLDGQELRDDTCHGQGSRQTFVHFIEVDGTRTSFQVLCGPQESGWRFGGQLLPGTYRVEVEPRDYDTSGTLGSLPQGVAVVLPRLELNASHDALVLDVKTHAVSGSIVHGEAALPTGLCSDASSTPDAFGNHTYVELWDANTRVVTRLGVTCSSDAGWTFQGRVLPGRYAMSILPRATAATGEGAYPAVQGFVAPSLLDVSGDRQGVVLDITRHEVAGRIQYQFADIVKECLPDRTHTLAFIHPLTQRKQNVAIQCDGMEAATFHGAVFPGSYALDFDFGYPLDYPTNLPPVRIDGPRTDLVVSTSATASRVSGTLTLNGQQLGLVTTDICDRVIRANNSPWLWIYVKQHIVLVSTENGSRWKLPIQCGNAATSSDVWTFSGRAPPGSYRVQLEMDFRRHISSQREPEELLYWLPGPTHVLVPSIELSGGE